MNCDVYQLKLYDTSIASAGYL